MDIGASVRGLAHYVDLHVNGGRDALSEGLSLVCEPSVFSEMLRSTLRSEELFNLTLARSYYHPNGFAKIVLLSESSFQLRLHVWRAGDDLPSSVESVHSHRWDFTSTLLYGRYRYQEFSRSEDGDPFCAYTYFGREGLSSYTMQAAGTCRLSCVFDAVMAAGTMYTLSADVFHRVVCDPTETTVSLILQGPHRPAHPVWVFTENELPAGSSLPLVHMSRDSLIGYFDDLLLILP